MKIAILNEEFLLKAYLDRLKKLGELIIFNDTDSEEKAIERLKDVDIAIADGFFCPFNKKVLGSTNKLKLIVLLHTGFFMVDLEAAIRRGIKVANAPGFSKEAVAELAIGLMFAVNRKIAWGDREMRKEPLEADPGNRDYDKFWGFNLKGRTWGVIGLGKIGSVVAQLARGLGMKVIAYNRSPKDVEHVEMVSLEELLKRSDVVSIHVPLNPETEHIISKRELDLMKPTAILINSGQAKNVDTDAIYQALKNNKIAGAGLDVVEGLGKDHPILSLDNVVFTPHLGSSTRESFLENLPAITVENIESFIQGSPKNLVNLK